jgi:hypothetical protein
MRLEKKNEEMLARRKGLTGRTIIQTIWLAISFVAAYFFINYLIDQDYISYDQIYNGFSLPRSVPEWAILFGSDAHYCVHHAVHSHLWLHD